MINNMSAYTTIEITRQQAEEMVLACRNKGKNINVFQMMSNEELVRELHKYVYSGDYNDIVGVFYNYELNPSSQKDTN